MSHSVAQKLLQDVLNTQKEQDGFHISLENLVTGRKECTIIRAFHLCPQTPYTVTDRQFYSLVVPSVQQHSLPSFESNAISLQCMFIHFCMHLLCRCFACSQLLHFKLITVQLLLSIIFSSTESESGIREKQHTFTKHTKSYFCMKLPLFSDLNVVVPVFSCNCKQNNDWLVQP